jgi:amino acid transporter
MIGKEGNAKRASSSTHLRRQIGLLQLFTLAFGTIIGVGWITVMGSWLGQAGPIGALIGFAGGGLVIAIIGVCYAELAGMYPVSGGEIAYAYATYGPGASFVVSWFLSLVYIGLSAFEAISVAWVVSALFDGFGGPVIYTAFGHAVRLHAVLLGFAVLTILSVINFRGSKMATRFQDIMTYALLSTSMIFVVAAFIGGEAGNLRPLFVESGPSGSIAPGILAIFAATPFWFAGFDTIPQAMGESRKAANLKRMPVVILAAILLAFLFYSAVIFASAILLPRGDLLALELPMAGAFDAAFASPLLGKGVLIAGLCGLITTWNAVVFAAARVIFAQGRAHMLPHQLGAVHSRYGSPANAVIFVAIISAALSLLGRNAILPIVNIGAAALALVFAAMTFGVLRLRRTQAERSRPFRMKHAYWIAPLGCVASLAMLYLAVMGPYRNAGGVWPLEWTLLLVWLVLGGLLWMMSAPMRRRFPESERRALVLEADIPEEQDAE